MFLKYGNKGEFNKLQIFALMSEVMLKDFADLRMGTEIINSRASLTMTMTSIVDLQEIRDLVLVSRSQRLSRHEWGERLEIRSYGYFE